MIEILSRVRKGPLDWETQRMSPRPLRSQLKLYQPVENSVNGNRTLTSDPLPFYCACCVMRITDDSFTSVQKIVRSFSGHDHAFTLRCVHRCKDEQRPRLSKGQKAQGGKPLLTQPFLQKNGCTSFQLATSQDLCSCSHLPIQSAACDPTLQKHPETKFSSRRLLFAANSR